MHLTLQEIANIVGISVNTVKTILSPSGFSSNKQITKKERIRVDHYYYVYGICQLIEHCVLADLQEKIPLTVIEKVIEQVDNTPPRDYRGGEGPSMAAWNPTPAVVPAPYPHGSHPVPVNAGANYPTWFPYVLGSNNETRAFVDINWDTLIGNARAKLLRWFLNERQKDTD